MSDTPTTLENSATPRKKLGTALRVVLSSCVSGAIVAWLIGRLSGAESVLHSMARADLSWLVVALAALVSALFAAVSRWRFTLRAMGYELPFRSALFAVLGAMPLAILLPSRANDLLRARAVRDRIPVFATVGSVLAERLVDLLSLFLLAMVGAATAGLPWVFVGALLAVAGEVLAVGLAMRWGALLMDRWPGHRDKIRHVLAAFEGLRGRPAAFCSVLLTSLFAWLCSVANLFALCQAFGARVAPSEVLALWPLALFMGLMPLTFGGFGTRDAGFVYLLTHLAASPPVPAFVLAATLTYGLSTTALLALVGLPFMWVQWTRAAPRDARSI